MMKMRNFVWMLCVSLLLQMNFARAEGPPVRGDIARSDIAKSDIEVVLQQHKVVKHGDKESLEAVDHIKPGETVEYQAVYRNVSKKTVHELKATLPIPVETEYLAGSARPTKVEASVDGVNYAPVPLRRKIKSANGQIEEQDIPLSEYRSLRWTIGDLAAGQKVHVFARVHLAPVGKATTEEAKK